MCYIGRPERGRSLRKLHLPVATLLCAAALPLCFAEELARADVAGSHGGRLVIAQRAEPRSLNPLIAVDAASTEVIHRTMADLVHINRSTLSTEPALARSWSVSRGGLRYRLSLRRDVRFSDGHPFDADDVVFSFAAYLDERVHAPQRDLLMVGGEPVRVRKLDAYTVEVALAKPYAAAERLFDGFAILPRHLLEKAWKEGKLGEAWSLRTPPSEMAGLGPFRVKQVAAGQRIVLERNPYYWKADRAGRRLPYLDELVFVAAGNEDAQVLRFEAGETNVLNRVSARNFALLNRSAERRGARVLSLGPGLEFNFLFFNLNTGVKPEFAARQHTLGNRAFRRAVALAIDRQAIVRLIYRGYAQALATPVSPGNKAWVNTRIPEPRRDVPAARSLLKDAGFHWNAQGALLDPDGKPFEFSILTGASNADRVQMATLIQADLKELGITVHVTPLEFRSVLDRVLRSYEYDACLLSLASADADPNVEMNSWLSSGSTHFWHPSQKAPATAWEAEIDSLMRRQLSERTYAARKRMYDRVQQLLVDESPLIPLVSPHILVAADSRLANFRPAILDHYVLWNVEELSWTGKGGAPVR